MNISNISELKQQYLKHKKEIEKKLVQFSAQKPENWKHELFFCLLTPQSKAESCWLAIQELKQCKITQNNKQKVQNCLKTKTRFYKNKTHYLLELEKKWPKIKEAIKTEKDPCKLRDYLIKSIKGLGVKEASHFLRNIGKSNNQLAILDRHILRKLIQLKIIKRIPTLNKNNYLLIENKMKKLSKLTSIPLDALDLLFWKLESGRIFK